MNKLLRNRQFDVFRAGNSLGGAIDVSLPAPSKPIPNLDPKAQQRLLEEYDRKKNWLAEPGSVKPREVEKADEIESGKPSPDDDIPNFSRERGRSRRSRGEAAQRSDFEADEPQSKGKPRRESRLASEDSRSDARTAPQGRQESAGRIDPTGAEASKSRTISEVLAADADHKNWFKAPTASDSAGSFGFNSAGSRPGTGFEGFSGTAAAASRAGVNPATPSAPDLLGSPATGFESDPGRRFDPTVAPGSAFSQTTTSDPGVFPKSGAAAGAFSAAPAASEAGFGAFGRSGGTRGLEGSVRSMFGSPAGDSSPSFRPSTPFTPRPAVLTFPKSGPF